MGLILPVPNPNGVQNRALLTTRPTREKNGLARVYTTELARVPQTQHKNAPSFHSNCDELRSLTQTQTLAPDGRGTNGNGNY